MRLTRTQSPACRNLIAHRVGNTCIYTVSMDSPQMQACRQESAGVLHQALSANRSEQFGQEYGVWLKEWRLLQRAIFVLDRNAHIVWAEYVADQLRELDNAAAIQAVQRATVE
jgi:thiol peroxidase